MILRSCTYRPVARIDDGPRDQRKAVVLHTAVSKATSLYDFWQGGSAGPGIGAHIYIAQDGHAEQYLDTSRMTGHAWAANPWTVAIETWDNADPAHTPWTVWQLAKIIAICKELGVPGKSLLATASDGVGYHRQYATWNLSGHSCPDDPRIVQVKYIISALAAPPPTGGFLMGLTDAQQSKVYDVLASGDDQLAAVGGTQAGYRKRQINSLWTAGDGNVRAAYPKATAPPYTVPAALNEYLGWLDAEKDGWV